MDLPSLLNDPCWFPHRIDFAEGTLELRPTTRDRLAAEPFIDGRTDFSTGASHLVPLDRALATALVPGSEPDRLIFHMGFCGSTLLATILDRPGKVFVAREPNILVDLADASRSGEAIDASLDMALGLLRRPFSEGEQSVIKPSNWVNGLLPVLARRKDLRALFVTTTPRDALIAALRGGRERLTFVLSLGQHLSVGLMGAPQVWRTSAVEIADPLDRAARMVLAVHWMQERLFAAATSTMQPGSFSIISFEEIRADLTQSAVKARDTLESPLSDEEIDEAAGSRSGRNAKQRGADYSPDRRAAEDDMLLKAHGARIDRALRWAEQTLPAA
jgi:hypothetical protein